MPIQRIQNAEEYPCIIMHSGTETSTAKPSDPAEPNTPPLLLLLLTSTVYFCFPAGWAPEMHFNTWFGNSPFPRSPKLKNVGTNHGRQIQNKHRRTVCYPGIGKARPRDSIARWWPGASLINCLKPIIPRNMRSVSAFVLMECRFWTRLGSI